MLICNVQQNKIYKNTILVILIHIHLGRMKMKSNDLSRRDLMKLGGKATGFVILAAGAINLKAFNAWAANKKSLA